MRTIFHYFLENRVHICPSLAILIWLVYTSLMAAQTTSIPLNDGADMPNTGVVSFRRDNVRDLKETLTTCIERGLRHFEISDMYGNANVVVEHILAHEVTREELYFTMKVGAQR